MLGVEKTPEQSSGVETGGFNLFRYLCLSVSICGSFMFLG
jgi:hypothetical protein